MDAYDIKTVYQTQRGWEPCVLANELATISRLLLLWWRWMGGRRRRPTNTVKLTIFPVTSYPWQGRCNNRCIVRGVRGAWCAWCIVHFAWCIERGALRGWRRRRPTNTVKLTILPVTSIQNFMNSCRCQCLHFWSCHQWWLILQSLAIIITVVTTMNGGGGGGGQQ